MNYWKMIINAKKNTTADIYLYEQIGESFWDDSGIGAKQFAEDLKALGDGINKINLFINSPGGSVFEGLAIYNLLKHHKASVSVRIDGIAASIASVIAMAGDEIIMPANAIMMIHDPAGMVMGDSDEMRKLADILDKIKDSLITAYSSKVDMSDKDIADLMSDETWMSAEEAVEWGFADEVVDEIKVAAYFDLSNYSHAPQNAVKDVNDGISDKNTVVTKIVMDGEAIARALEDVHKTSGSQPLTGHINNNSKEVKAMNDCKVCGNALVEGSCPHCLKAATEKAKVEEVTRVKEITALGKKYGFEDIATDYIDRDESVENFKDYVLKNLEVGKPIATSGIKVGEDNEATKPFDSFGEQLMSVVQTARNPGVTADKRLLFLNAASGGQEGVDSDGGFLVQTDFSGELMKVTYDTGVLINRCRKIPISGNANGIKINAIDESSRATGSRFGGVQAYWGAEADSATAKKPKFRQMELTLNKLLGLCYMTDELLSDASAVESVVMQAFPEEFNFMMDDAIISGSGSGKPLGIMGSPALITVAKETGQTANTIVVENIVKMYSRCHARTRQNAVWFINQEIEPQLFTMGITVGLGGAPIYMPPGGISGSPYATLLGRPIIAIEHAAALGTTGDISLFDLQQYLLIDKGGINAASSMHVKFITDEMTFRFTYRVDGQPIWNSDITPYNGNNTLSPYVTLATRS